MNNTNWVFLYFELESVKIDNKNDLCELWTHNSQQWDPFSQYEIRIRIRILSIVKQPI